MTEPNDNVGGPEAGVPGTGGDGIRYFPPTNLAVNNRMSVLALVFILGILGTVAYLTIPKEASPEITIPMISVSTVYPGVTPEDMETLITRVIEDELNTIPELTQLTSVSVQGYSNVTAEFNSDMDMEAALQKVREKVDLAKPDLPADAEDPVLSEFNFSEFPIMQVNISAEYDLVRLKEVAEDIQDRLEQIPSILQVRLSGGLEREVKVDVDLVRLKFYAIAFSDVIEAIASENVTIPGGGIDVGSQEFLVRVAGEFTDPAIIEDIVITTKAGRPIYVRDIASVDFGFQDRASYARLDGSAVVTLDIIKRSGENIIETSDAVKAAIEQLEPTFPPTTVVKVTGDQSQDIRTIEPREQHHLGPAPRHCRAALLPGRAQRDVRGHLDSAVHAALVHHHEHRRHYDEHGGSVRAHSRAGHAGGQRDRGGREHLSTPGTGFRWIRGGAPRHGRGRTAHHHVDADHAGGILSDAVLAGHRRRIHGLPAAHADYHAVQLAVRCARDRAAADGDLHAARPCTRGAAPAGGALDTAGGGSTAPAVGRRDGEPARGGPAGGDRGRARHAAPRRPLAGRTLVPGPRNAGDPARLREAPALGAAPSLHRGGRLRRGTDRHRDGVRRVECRHRVLPGKHPAGRGLRAHRCAGRHGRGLHG
jgi:hypothetical protein